MDLSGFEHYWKHLGSLSTWIKQTQNITYYIFNAVLLKLRTHVTFHKLMIYSAEV